MTDHRTRFSVAWLTLILAINMEAPAWAQDKSGLAAKIDPIFARWNSTESPGYAVGVVQNGELVFAKGYGMANLEYGVPITAQSRFYIGSMSKQITAAAVALLVQQGKVQLTDDVHKYVPELPDYGHSITVDNLIHHTSGIRDWTSIHLFSGLDPRYEDRLDNSDVLQLILRQRSLNFVPGTDFRYSSSGYILLAKIVERASGQTLPEFAKQNIFGPLGMEHTLFDDNYARILPQRVESYRQVGNHHYERWLKHFNIYGDGGVISTVEDLAKWDTNFYRDQLGNSGLVEMLLTRGRLNSGEQIHYAFGLELDTHNGYRVVKHNGGMLGFNVDMVRFPDQRLTVIVLGNSQDAYVTGLAFDIADRLLPAKQALNSKPSMVPASQVTLTSDESKKYEGSYAIRDLNNRWVVRLKDGQLSVEGTEQRLLPVGPSKFRLLERDGVPSSPPAFVSFQAGKDDAMSMHFSSGAPLGSFDGDRYDPTLPSSLEELKPLIGKYRSDELHVTYSVWEDGGELYMQLGTAKPISLFPRHDDPRVEWNSRSKVWIGFGMVTFVTGKDGAVTGLNIGDGWVKEVYFAKTESPSEVTKRKLQRESAGN